MANSFIAGLTAYQRSLLDSAGISSCELEIDSQSGIVIESSDLHNLLNVLDASLTKVEPTGYEGVERAFIKLSTTVTAFGKFKIIALAADTLDEKLVSLLTDIMLPRVERDIVLHCELEANPAVRDGRFHLHIWHHSSRDVRESQGRCVDQKLWGQVLDNGRRFARKKLVGGAAIVDPQSKAVVAELVGDSNLFVHVDLLPVTGAHGAILRKILEQAVMLLLSPEEWSTLEGLRFVENCAKGLVRALQLTTGDPEKRKQTIKQLRQRLGDETRNGMREEKTLLGGGREQQTIEASFGAEYEALLRIPKIKDVRLDGSSIVVITEVLNCLDDRSGRLHEIGAFKISLPLDGNSPRWNNLTRRVDGYRPDQHAPHIWSSGGACLGNSETLFSELLSQRQFAIAAQLAIEFVESANTSDPAGAGIKKWPLAKNQNESVRAVKEPVTDEEHERFKRMYIAACASRIDDLSSKQRASLIVRRASIERVERQLVAELRALMLATRKIKGLAAVNREALKLEYEALLAAPKVSGVSSELQKIIVTTETLNCSDPTTGRRHELGKFAIEIYLDGEASSVRWFNQSRQVDALLCEQPAPNVLKSGRALFSDIRENFPDLIAQMKFASAAALAIAYIEEVTASDFSEQVDKWPLSKQ